MECPYAPMCRNIPDRYKSALNWETSHGNLSALVSHYAPCRNGGGFPSQSYLTALHQMGITDLSAVACYNGEPLSSMFRPPPLNGVHTIKS